MMSYYKLIDGKFVIGESNLGTVPSPLWNCIATLVQPIKENYLQTRIQYSIFKFPLLWINPLFVQFYKKKCCNYKYFFSKYYTFGALASLVTVQRSLTDLSYHVEKKKMWKLQPIIILYLWNCVVNMLCGF